VELVRRILDCQANADVRDSRGLSALAVATAAKRWQAADELLKAGCRADGRSGALALAAVQRAGQFGSGSSTEEIEQAHALEAAILERQQRPPASTLAEYFEREVRGEVVLGIEPRRFELRGEKLHRRTGGLCIWARALVIEPWAEQHDVVFLQLGSEEGGVPQPEVADLAGKELLNEDVLLKEVSALALPVALPASRLSPGRRHGTRVVRSGRGSGLVRSVPALAQMPKRGSLRVSGSAACCGESMGRIEVLVNGVRVGETPQLAPTSDETSELSLPMPLQEIEVGLELSGLQLRRERLTCSEDLETDFCADVPVVIFIYVQPIEGDEPLDFIFLCGHRRDVPFEDGAKPFVGEVVWDGGSSRLTAVSPLVLGTSNCLARMQSLQLRPDLPPGRRYEAVEWEDTGDCQFRRVVNNPVRVGKICVG